VGSIAYKLALLINGDCDFVITKRPKNIWDIAAGTHICKKFGFEVSFLEGDSTKITQDLYQAPMIWCRKNNITQLIDQFKTEKK
jgi:myo-inositol-1(or 4)-monophosphatase